MSEETLPETIPPTTEEATPEIVKKTEKNGDFWQFTAELVRTVLVVGVAAFLIRYFVLQPFIVEGESMSPEFHTNDYLLVDKLSYRFSEPQRGDIVVFQYPRDVSINYVKRIIGLPGETVDIENGRVKVTNSSHPDGFYLDETYLPDTIRTQLLTGSADGHFTVPSDSYYVLGDNRGNSSDSREWGELPKKDLIGRVIFRAYPFTQMTIVHHARYSS